MNTAANLVLGLAVLVWIVARQVRTSEVRADRSPRTLLVLGLVGLWQVVQFLQQHTVAAGAVAVLVVSLVVSAGLGVLRGRLQPVWRADDGRVLRRGNATTVVLWLLAVGLHLGADVLAEKADARSAGLASASLLLYLAISLATQRLVVQGRAARLVAPATQPVPGLV